MLERDGGEEKVAGASDTIYLCNFRVSVDGEWLCLKELQEFSDLNTTFPTTPELEKITYYPNYPVGPRERDPVLIERSNLVNISKLVIKEVIDSSLRFGRQLDSDHIPLHHFFIVLEHVLRHGLKPKKGLLGPKKELWDLLQKVEKLDADAADITASVRDLPTVRSHMGRARAWLRLALMQKKLADYFKVLMDRDDLLAEFYESRALIRSDEATLIYAILGSLNVVDCNLCIKEEELDSQQGVIDFSLYLRSKKEMVDTESVNSKGEEEENNMSTVLDQKNYIEELNRHLNATVTNLQAKVESLTTTNALMKEDLTISRGSMQKCLAENKRLATELEKTKILAERNARLRSNSETGSNKSSSSSELGMGSPTCSLVTNIEASTKSLSQDFRVRLEQEMVQREEAEKGLNLQQSLKAEMEMVVTRLEKEVSEKQSTIASLRDQLEDIKFINLEMYTKLAECEYEISQKGDLVAKLEDKTKEISQMLTNLNNMTKAAEAAKMAKSSEKIPPSKKYAVVKIPKMETLIASKKDTEKLLKESEKSLKESNASSSEKDAPKS